VVVILSTHIVETSPTLPAHGRPWPAGASSRKAAPGELTHELAGRIWKKAIDKTELDAERRPPRGDLHAPVGRRTVIHVLADASPGPGFQPVAGGLEDVYFSTLAASRRAA